MLSNCGYLNSYFSPLKGSKIYIKEIRTNGGNYDFRLSINDNFQVSEKAWKHTSGFRVSEGWYIKEGFVTFFIPTITAINDTVSFINGGAKAYTKTNFQFDIGTECKINSEILVFDGRKWLLKSTESALKINDFSDTIKLSIQAIVTDLCTDKYFEYVTINKEYPVKIILVTKSDPRPTISTSSKACTSNSPSKSVEAASRGINREIQVENIFCKLSAGVFYDNLQWCLMNDGWVTVKGGVVVIEPEIMIDKSKIVFTKGAISVLSGRDFLIEDNSTCIYDNRKYIAKGNKWMPE